MRNILKCMAFAAATLTLSGCAASSKSPASYLGVDLKPAANAEPSKLQSLASRAKSGDKQSQLELGILFEAGRASVEKDIGKAKKLYAEAAKDTPITQTTFISENGIVKAETTNAGVRNALPAARERLNALNDSNDRDRSEKRDLNAEKHGLILVGPQLRGGTGYRALRQLIKLEYFSDLCLYDVIESTDKRKAAGVSDIKKVYTSKDNYSEQKVDSFELAQRCLDLQTLPADCQLYQEEMLKAIMVTYADERFHMFVRIIPYLAKSCVRKKWVAENWSTTSRNKFPSPLDYILYNKGFRSHYKWQSPLNESSELVPKYDGLFLDTLIIRPLAQSYWTRRCSDAHTTVYGYNFEEIDLLVCSGSHHSKMSRSVKKHLENLGVDYAE